MYELRQSPLCPPQTYDLHSERSMAVQLCTCLEFLGYDDPALKAPTDRATNKHGPIQPKLADGFKRSDMTAVVFGLTSIHAFHGWSTANSITI